MLTILNNYAYGYVTIPVILACKAQGLFDKLSYERPVHFTQLVKELRANHGYS
uniref:hypothetical protein n=1 Tax=Paenibacillus sp. FSL R10-2782 TaxID=2954661 RepID=UPI00406C2D8D